jgi:hypothetical protein
VVASVVGGCSTIRFSWGLPKNQRVTARQLSKLAVALALPFAIGEMDEEVR